MANPRPSAWALVGVLVATSILVPAAAAPVSAADPTAVCTPGQLPTRWLNQYQPPDTVRVLRAVGPNAGHVETVDFWKYVGTVLRTEFSGPNWNAATMRVGALAVKQYAWYYAMYWRGGSRSFTVTDPVTNITTTTTECFDLKDSTADQLYRPEKLVNGVWQLKNAPAQVHLEAMAATWHISLRKDFLKKRNAPNRMFLTGYRSGRLNPCGFEDGWFRLYQKSLRDCGVKGLTIEEMWRTYYGQNLYVVDIRDHDVLVDADWRGDAAVLTPSGGQSNLSVLGASDSGFDAPVGVGLAIDLDNVLDQAIGDVTGVEVPADDLSTDADVYRRPRAANNLADVVLLMKDADRKIQVIKSTGNDGDRFASPIIVDVPDDVTRILVDDFDGDMNADIALLRSTPTEPGSTEPATLRVMRSQGGGNFSDPIDWWRGSLDLASQQVMSGDVNTDGKADLIITDGNAFSVAPSTPTCLALSPRGACASVPPTRIDVVQPWLSGAGWTLATARFAVGDSDRDGRDDVYAMVKDGSGTKVLVVRTSRVESRFKDPELMWQSSALDFASARPVSLHGDLDGLADLAILQNTSGGLSAFWLKSAAASMTPVGSPVTSNETTWGDASAF